MRVQLTPYLNAAAEVQWMATCPDGEFADRGIGPTDGLALEDLQQKTWDARPLPDKEAALAAQAYIVEVDW